MHDCLSNDFGKFWKILSTTLVQAEEGQCWAEIFSFGMERGSCRCLHRASLIPRWGDRLASTLAPLWVRVLCWTWGWGWAKEFPCAGLANLLVASGLSLYEVGIIRHMTCWCPWHYQLLFDLTHKTYLPVEQILIDD